MDMNAEYLNYIYQNATMGADSIDVLMKTIPDTTISEYLQKQKEDYQCVKHTASAKLHDRGDWEKDIPAMRKAMSYVTINAQMMLDKTPTHVAEMMMQGNVMGIIDITKNRKRYKNAEEDIVKLGDQLLKLEDDAFTQWRRHLRDSVC